MCHCDTRAPYFTKSEIFFYLLLTVPLSKILAHINISLCLVRKPELFEGFLPNGFFFSDNKKYHQHGTQLCICCEYVKIKNFLDKFRYINFGVIMLHKL